MQLQRQLSELQEANIEVYGVSYDTVEELKQFSEQYGITYNLLSDADSATIKRFGILNTLIEEDNPIKTAAGRSYYGIPFPGVYVINQQGVVTEKFFNRSYSTRNSAGTILNSALGEVLKPEAEETAEFSAEQIKFSAFLADPELKLEYSSTLYVRFELAEGFHIYADPLPSGFFATTVTVQEKEGLTLGDAIYPSTKIKEFKELEVELPIYEGNVDVAIPITANAKILNWMLPEKPESIDVDIDVRYQVCSESICYLPKQETLTMTLPLGALQR